jgi:hypothetical protein
MLLHTFIAKRYFSAIMSRVKPITSSQLLATIQENEQKRHSDIRIIDVRERSEIEQEGKIKNAINVPFKLSPDMFAAGLSDFNKHDMVTYTRIYRVHFLNMHVLFRSYFIVNQVVVV